MMFELTARELIAEIFLARRGVLFTGFGYRDAEAARFLLPAACFRQQ